MCYKTMKKVLASVCLLTAISLTAAIEVKETSTALDLRNGKIALQITHGERNVTLSYRLGDKWVTSSSIALQKKRETTKIKACKITANTPQQISVEVEYGAGKVTFSVIDGSEYLQCEADFADGQTALTGTMNSEAMVIPDFLAGNLVFYPETAPAATLNVPADNFMLVNMIDSGNAMLALLWNSPTAKVTEERKDHRFTTLQCTAAGRTEFRLGMIAAPGIWYKITEKLNPTDFTEINWKPPFSANWQMTTMMTKGFFTDKSTFESWKPAPTWSDGYGILNQEAHTAWSSAIGSCINPCQFKNDKTLAKIPVLGSMAATTSFSPGPYLFYALTRIDKTPKNIIMPSDELKKMLSADAYAAITLRRSVKNKYPPTCGITQNIEKIFYRSESKKERKQIQEDLEKMNMFVLVCRERIEEYVAWQQKMHPMFEAQKKDNPTLAPLIANVEKDLSQIATRYAAMKDAMKTPDYCKGLSDKIIGLCDSSLSDEDKEEQCKQLGRNIRSIGGAQDATLGLYRMVVKAMRQYATVKLLTTVNPAEKKLLEKIRTETAIILNNCYHMEGKYTI